MWVVCEGNHLTEPGTLEVLDAETLEPIEHVELGLYPDDIVYLPAPEGT